VDRETSREPSSKRAIAGSAAPTEAGARARGERRGRKSNAKWAPYRPVPGSAVGDAVQRELAGNLAEPVVFQNSNEAK